MRTVSSYTEPENGWSSGCFNRKAIAEEEAMMLHDGGYVTEVVKASKEAEKKALRRGDISEGCIWLVHYWSRGHEPSRLRGASIELGATSTPWGPAQSRNEIAKGVSFYSTASHGGFKLSPKRDAQVPAYMRKRGGWYEEDVDWAIVAAVFPDLFKPEEVEAAKGTLRNYYPDMYEQFYEVTLHPGESRVRDEEAFRGLHRADYIGMAAWGDWHSKVPKGYVAVFAGRGGRTKTGAYPKDTAYFLVPQEEYEARRPFGFVVDPERHEQIEAVA